MYAIIKACGKQYKMTEGTNLRVEKLAGDAGANINFADVLMVGGEGAPRFGTPTVANASVAAEIVRHAKAKKVMIYKKKRRKGYEKKRGHRQEFTEIKITKINA